MNVSKPVKTLTDKSVNSVINKGIYFPIFFFNAGSIVNKRDRLDDFLNSKLIFITFIVETWLKLVLSKLGP